MEKEAVTLEGIARVMDQRLEVFGKGIEKKIDDAVEELAQRVARQFEAHHERFGGIEERLDSIDTKFDGIERRFDAIDQRFDGVDKKFDAIDQRFDDVDKRFDMVDQKFDTFEQRMDKGFNDANKRFDRLEMTIVDDHAQRIIRLEKKVLNA